MDRNRIWIIGAVLAMIAVGGLGWMLGVQPQLDAAAAADAQTSQVVGANNASAAVLARLKKDSEDLPALKSQLAELGASIPSSADTPAFVSELNGFAAATGATITAWSLSDAQPYVPPVVSGASTAASDSSGGSGSSASTPAPSSTPAPTPAPSQAPGAPPALDPLVAAAGFAVLPVSVTVEGGYTNILSFVDAAQKGGRLFLVNGLSVGPSGTGSGLTGKVSGYVYVLGAGGEPAPAK